MKNIIILINIFIFGISAIAQTDSTKSNKKILVVRISCKHRSLHSPTQDVGLQYSVSEATGQVLLPSAVTPINKVGWFSVVRR
jgi:hypothetical protein